MQQDIEQWQQWIGREQTAVETLSPWPVRGLQATLDQPPSAQIGGPLPAGGHWLYFLETVRQSDLDTDGHAKRGGFLPPVNLPRRMWAGGRLQFLQPLHLGESVKKISHVKNVVSKQGRSGPLVFVTVEHQFHVENGLALIERHDIVYRDDKAPLPQPAGAEEKPGKAPWQRTMIADEVMLMRYSALTFNGHRIHYDKDFAIHHDGYPGLVVHGPLMATLLMDLCRENHGSYRLSAFDFKARSALFAGEAFVLSGTPSEDGTRAQLVLQKQNGTTVMTAEAQFEKDG